MLDNAYQPLTGVVKLDFKQMYAHCLQCQANLLQERNLCQQKMLMLGVIRWQTDFPFLTLITSLFLASYTCGQIFRCGLSISKRLGI